ncbi:uncharacterized protein LOC105191039 isoform X2 [Harpegnathos saltator]|uniref:uncharacterized protein LOC105191039 isoform X2 n=1 Tax=Harpegnathos saltator TaxID=610380 RepID=UPI000DBEDE20|nr:uncharacterized protein LOC105191039 isoform X2 [Harpegnathos saltator]
MNVENFTPVLSWTSTLQKAKRNTYTSVSNAKEVEQEIDGKLPLMNGCNINKEESNIEAIGQDIHLGHNISVTKTAYEEIQRVKEPSKFVTNLAYAV